MKRNLAPRLVFGSWFALTVFCAAAETNRGLSLAAVTNETMSATINSVRRESNTVRIDFQVTGSPDFVHVETAPTVDGIYRVEQSASMTTISPGVMQAFLPVSTNDSFFRIRLISETQTNIHIVPREAELAFGSGFLPGVADSPFQQVYAAIEFSDTPTELIEIRELSFRLDEKAGNLDVVVPRLIVQMAIFHGSMSDLPRNSYVEMQDPKTVFDEENVRLKASIGGEPKTFGVRIKFETAFLYDRTLGQLVLQAHMRTPGGRGEAFDAVAVSADRGWIVLPVPFSSPNVGPGMIATVFSYIPVFRQPLNNSERQDHETP